MNQNRPKQISSKISKDSKGDKKNGKKKEKKQQEKNDVKKVNKTKVSQKEKKLIRQLLPENIYNQLWCFEVFVNF